MWSFKSCPGHQFGVLKQSNIIVMSLPKTRFPHFLLFQDAVLSSQTKQSTTRSWEQVDLTLSEASCAGINSTFQHVARRCLPLVSHIPNSQILLESSPVAACCVV